MRGAVSPARVMPLLRANPVLVALAAILAFFLATRLALLWRFPPFLDEANYAVWARDVHDSTEDRFIALANGRGPLFSWLGAVLIWLGAAPLTAVRLVSLGSGLISLGCVGILGRRLGGVWTGVAAAGLYAVVPYFVVHDSIGLFEPMIVALGLLALVLQIRLAEEPRLDLALLLGITLGAGLLAKESGRFALVLLPVSLLCFHWHEPGRRLRLARWAGCAVLSLAIAGALYSIMKLTPLYDQLSQAQKATEPIRSTSSALEHPLRWLDANWPGVRKNFFGYVTWPLLVLAAVGIGRGLRERWRFGVLLLVWFLVPLGAATLIVENTFARYTLQAVPPLIVFTAFGIVEVVRLAARLPMPRRALAVALTCGAVLVLVPAARLDGAVLADPNRAQYPGSSDDEYATGWPAGNAWVAAAHHLHRLVPTDKAYVMVFDQGSNAFALSLPANISNATNDAQQLNAQFVITNGRPVPANHGPGELRDIWEYHRPRNGVPLVLYERGVTVDGAFYSTPEQLRGGLRLSDKQFDAFVSSHSAVKAWYDGAVSAAS